MAINFKNMAKKARKSVLIRIPLPLYKSVQKQAEQNNRTFTAHINEILQTATLPRTGETTSSANTVTITA